MARARLLSEQRGGEDVRGESAVQRKRARARARSKANDSGMGNWIEYVRVNEKALGLVAAFAVASA